MGLLAAVWQNRQFIVSSVRAEFKGRFARSRLGGLWYVLNPLAQAAIFSFVLSEVLSARLGASGTKSSYAVYLLAGMAGWGLFAEITNRCTSVFIEFAGAMKKIAFPRISLPMIVFGSAATNHAFLIGATLTVIVALGYYPNAAWLSLPVGIVLISALALAIGVLLGILNVFARDVSQVANVLMQLWFWITPIVYPITALPKEIRWVVDMNPMVPLVAIYQNALLLGEWPNWNTLIMPVFVIVILLAMTTFIFRRATPEIVDAL